MKKILLTLLGLLLIPSLCFADTATRHTTYATTSEVNATNLNGNFDNLVIVLNGGLDNTNADTASGYRFLEVLGALPSAGTQGRSIYLTTNNTLNFDTGSAFTQAITASGTPAQGDIIYYNGTAWARLGYGTSGQFLKTQGSSANPIWDGVAWTSYGSTSTVVGWSSTSNKEIYYKRIGNMVLVGFNIIGTSDSATTTFTLPFTASNTMLEQDFSFAGQDNTADLTKTANGNIAKNTSLVHFYPGISGNWTTSGSKLILGQFWIEVEP